MASNHGQMSMARRSSQAACRRSASVAVPALALALALAAPDADAQNWLPNGDFPMALAVNTGWAFDPDITLAWDPLDRFGGGLPDNSGSMKATTASCGLPCTAPIRSADCFAVSPGQHLLARGSAFIPAQAASPTAHVDVVFYDTPNICQSVDIVETVPVLTTQATGVWVDDAVEAIAPDPVTGVRFQLVVEEAAVANAVVHFDELFLPEPAPGPAGAAVLGALGALALGRRRAAPAVSR
jgi:hypothetical protein